jgi:hypothetical protein
VTRALCVAVLGLGEAGSEIARDLVAAGVVVRGYDPVVPAAADVVACTSEAEAVTGAALVLSVNSAADAVPAACAAFAMLPLPLSRAPLRPSTWSCPTGQRLDRSARPALRRASPGRLAAGPDVDVRRTSESSQRTRGRRR